MFVEMWFWINSTPATGEQKTAAHLEVFKTTASVAVMLGGIGALYLAARRQRTQEAEHAHAVRIAEINRQHAERVAAATEDDAARRRVTELYTKAADQLGSDKAPVRLAGLYALERLGQDNSDQRRTIASLWCAYLRMPYTPPPPTVGRRPGGVARPLLSNPRRRTGILRPDPATLTSPNPAAAHAEAVLERDVRLTVQRLLGMHLRPRTDNNDQPHHDYWPEIPDLDLTGATLINLDLSSCALPAIRMDRATFIGRTTFGGATFTGRATFYGATFNHQVQFAHATFNGAAMFYGATFIGRATFVGATFDARTQFDGATFNANARFEDATFNAIGTFVRATFTEAARFNRVTFAGVASFDMAAFAAIATFNRTAFNDRVTFDDAAFAANTSFVHATFNRVTFDDAAFAANTLFVHATFKDHARFDSAVFDSTARCRNARVSVGGVTSQAMWPVGWTCVIPEPLNSEDVQWGQLVPVPMVLDQHVVSDMKTDGF
ncbi:pentapeptide repeat-containing protein [Lentzea indica]|uniref:pentapeptide repeat-containing protein n=1 Tax=Lentzea indica TaxID=2604800 RepID=UPI0014396E9A|nr:pentapeptide repeat-containing protein [Lentzea indica]